MLTQIPITSIIFQIHFEQSQFKLNRADGWIPLKKNAVPTLFNIPNPPPRFNPSPRKSSYKVYKSKESDKSWKLINEEKQRRCDRTYKYRNFMVSFCSILTTYCF